MTILQNILRSKKFDAGQTEGISTFIFSGLVFVDQTPSDFSGVDAVIENFQADPIQLVMLKEALKQVGDKVTSFEILMYVCGFEEEAFELLAA